MTTQPSRRQFLGQGAGALGILALAGRPRAGGADDAPQAREMTRKAVEFLRSRQEPNGGWSTDRNEPGVTALVVTALLRSGQVTPNDPAVTKGLTYLDK